MRGATKSLEFLANSVSKHLWQPLISLQTWLVFHKIFHSHTRKSDVSSINMLMREVDKLRDSSSSPFTPTIAKNKVTFLPSEWTRMNRNDSLSSLHLIDECLWYLNALQQRENHLEIPALRKKKQEFFLWPTFFNHRLFMSWRWL